jgi:hypothetical protein
MNNDYDEEVKKVAEEAFSNTARLATARLGPRDLSPTQSDGGGSVNSSRRSPSMIKTKDEAGLFEVMSSATSVVLSRRKKKSTLSPPPAAAPAPSSPDPTSDTKSTSAATGAGTVSSAGKNLDLANNDNSFFVIANLLVDYFQSRVVKNSGIQGDDSPDAKLLLQPDDKESLERLLPQKARSNFIMAVQERLGNTPAVPTSPLQFLTLQCQELNLDQDDEVNPLLAVLELTTDSVLIEILPSSALHQAMASASFTATAAATTAATTTSPPGSILSPTESQTTEMQENLSSKRPASGVPVPGALAASMILTSVQEDSGSQKKDSVAGGTNNFFGMSTAAKSSIPTQVSTPAPVPAPEVKQEPPAGPIDAPIIRPDPTGDNDSAHTFERYNDSNRTESLARQQLLAELREASNLMANSVTPETAKFWRDHVLELQARLRALHGEGTSVSGLRNTQSPTPEDILESNRRLLSEFQQREQYVPPVIDSPSLKSLEAKTEPGAVDAPPVGGGRKIDSSTTPPSKISLLKDTPQTPGNNDSLGPPTSRTPMNMAGGIENTPVVDVVAPADLPGGYRFEAEIEGQRFLAVVPAGGVRQGDTFSCYMRELDSVAIDIPVGYWKDGIVNWFKFGVCHQVVWNSVVCPLSKSFFVSFLLLVAHLPAKPDVSPIITLCSLSCFTCYLLFQFYLDRSQLELILTLSVVRRTALALFPTGQ